MSQTKHKRVKNRAQYTMNLALAAVAGEVGCVTLIIVVVALLAGLWLDNRFNSSPIFVIILLIASVPVTVVLMLRIVKSVTARIKTTTENEIESNREEANRGIDPK